MRIAAVLAVAGGLAACTRIEAIPVSPAALVTLTAASAAPVVETTPDDTPPPRYEVERLDGRLIRVYRPFGVWVSTGSTVFRLADPVRATISDDRLLLESRGHQRVSVPLGAVTAVELRQPRFDGRRTAINTGIVAGVAVLCAVAGVLLMSSAGAPEFIPALSWDLEIEQEREPLGVARQRELPVVDRDQHLTDRH